jgi:hypothetical protein
MLVLPLAACGSVSRQSPTDSATDRNNGAETRGTEDGGSPDVGNSSMKVLRGTISTVVPTSASMANLHVFDQRISLPSPKTCNVSMCVSGGIVP